MRTIVLILLLFALHSARATLDLQAITNKVQDLKETAANNIKDLVDNIDLEKVKQLDVLNILPKVQRKVEFGKKLYEQKHNIGQVVLDYKKAKFNDKLQTLQKVGQFKHQALQGLVEKKKELFKQKQTLAQQLLEEKEKLVHALVHEKQHFVQDLVDFKKEKLATLLDLAPPKKKIIYVKHPPHIIHKPKIIHGPPKPIYGPPLASHFEDHHHHHVSPHKEVYYEEIAPHKLVKVVKPLPYKKVIIHTKIYD
ncbi:hypothetical protein O0L34_g18574 [Tuta absoluta]|nr:hypothetical protein O0L34_g18574 [Tuta absoluta]